MIRNCFAIYQYRTSPDPWQYIYTLFYVCHKAAQKQCIELAAPLALLHGNFAEQRPNQTKQ